MIELKNVSREFINGKEITIALKEINYKFNKSGFYVISGPSGSGKSTLLHILAGLDNCARGSVLFKNENIIKYNYNKSSLYREKYLGIIYQNHFLIPYLMVEENIMLNKNIENNKIIETLGIKRLLKRDITKLSGGQKQRVSLARALIHNPLIILADEPTGSLDKNNAQKVMEILKRESINKLVIMVSHDIMLCKKYADIILYLREGVIEKEDIINSNKNANIKNNKKIKRKKYLLKLAFKFIKYKKKRIMIASICCSIGLIGMMLSIILTNGFTTFFNQQFKNSINSNIIYGYPENNEKISTISLLDIQRISSEYNVPWGVFYTISNEYKSFVKVNDREVEWLNIDNLFHYRASDEDVLENIDSFILDFPRSYYQIFIDVFELLFVDEYEINEYLKKENKIFTFSFYIEDSLYEIPLRLKKINWTQNSVEIVHSSSFWLEDLSYKYGVNIENDLESKNIVRYPYLLNIDNDTQSKILQNKNYQDIIFEWNNEYKLDKITLCFYGNTRICQDSLKEYLKYDGIVDYMYISNNGINIEQNMPSLEIDNLKGRNISFFPINLNDESIKEQYILYGNIPKNNLEIIVSKHLFNQLKISLNDNVNFKHNLNKEINVKVVGYIEGNNVSIIYQKASWSYEFFIEELDISIVDFPCYQISLLIDKNEIIPVLTSFLNTLDNTTYISPFWEATKEIENLLSYFQKGIIILSLFSVFASILLIGIIVFLNTIEQKKYDAILMMQGYTKKNIIRLHFYQNMFMCFISFIIMFFSSFLIVFEVNTVFSLMVGISYYSFASLSFNLLLKFLFYLFIISLIFTYIPILVIKFNNPLKVLKE